MAALKKYLVAQASRLCCEQSVFSRTGETPVPLMQVPLMQVSLMQVSLTQVSLTQVPLVLLTLVLLMQVP